MVHQKDTANLMDVLLQSMGSADPILHMLEWLCDQLMEAEDSLAYLAFPSLDARKISSNNLMERLNKEIRRRTKVIGIFPNPDSYVRLIAIYLMEYSEDWSASQAYLSEKSIQAMPLPAAV